MPSINNESFSHIIRLLEIPTSRLINELYVSQSLISRWKTGSRELKSNSQNYARVLNLFLKINTEQGIFTLEHLLFSTEELGACSYTSIQKQLPCKLSQYLLRPPKNISLTKEPFANGALQTILGIENRIAALVDFFEYALKQTPKPDLYILELDNILWCPSNYEWKTLYPYYCKKYMDMGGKIFLFSNLHCIERAFFYEGWKCTSHSNLFPGYTSTTSGLTTGSSYYLLKNHRSISFFVPEDSLNEYYTFIVQEQNTLTAQYNFLKKIFEQRNHPILIDKLEKKNFALSTILLHNEHLEPMILTGKQIHFIFSNATKLTKILQHHAVPKKKIDLCLKFQDALRSQLLQRKIRNKSLLYFQEDLESYMQNEPTLDSELTAIVGKNIYLSQEDKIERILNLKLLLSDNLIYSCYIIPKSLAPLYDKIGENLLLWIKKDKWFFVFYEKADHSIEMRLILDHLASTIRYDMFHELFQLIPSDKYNNKSAISFLNHLVSANNESHDP